MSILLWRRLGRRDYRPVWTAMRTFTDRRTPDSADELWTLEHLPVFTLGQAGRTEHLLNPGSIPVVHSDRGGQVTYHGPGQLVAYLLYDLRRGGLGVRALVERLERSALALLAELGIEAGLRSGAPGVYVDGRKIASLGLRVRRGCSYHGLSLNVDLDPAPFGRIDPCGYPGLAVTRTADLGVDLDVAQLAPRLAVQVARQLEAELRPAPPPVFPDAAMD